MVKKYISVSLRHSGRSCQSHHLAGKMHHQIEVRFLSFSGLPSLGLQLHKFDHFLKCVFQKNLSILASQNTCSCILFYVQFFYESQICRFDRIVQFWFHRKIITLKHLPLQSSATSTLRKFYRKTHFRANVLDCATTRNPIYLIFFLKAFSHFL